MQGMNGVMLALPLKRSEIKVGQLIEIEHLGESANQNTARVSECILVMLFFSCGPGDCGGCWAFSAAEVLADRFCIAASKSNLSQFRNLSLSPQWVLDCDKTNRGCGGGLLDDAWKFLESTGAVTEEYAMHLFYHHAVLG